ncbi:MAG: hypothetical protein ACRECG_15345 [Bradyrhizobium sp.]
MRTTHRPLSLTSISGMISWLLKLATRMLARGLDMPEPLLHHAGVFVFAQIAAFENSVGKSLCPSRLLRHFRGSGR